MATTIPEGDILALYDEFGRRRSDPSSPADLESSFDASAAYERPQMVAPVSTPRDAPRPRTRPENASIRLRSNSGLSMHTNEIALRQYTDYNPDGSPRASVFGSSNWRAEQLHSIDQMSSAGRAPMGASTNGSQNSPLVPDFMGREVFQMALNNPTTLHRLLKYAQSQGRGENVEFLIKLQEYSRSLEAVTSLLSQISTNYTSLAAVSPLGFPLLLSKSVNSDIKNITTTILPGLEMLFLEARCFIEQRVFTEIFPGFIRHQLAITTALSLTQTAPPTPTWSSTDETPSGSPICEYPGLGDAFCLTDPSSVDNPIIYSSDGFINVTGFNRREIARNCRFLQGPQTDKAAVRRLGTAIANKGESVELLMNYRKDGKPFWNLLYTTPVPDQNGNVKFFLGGQINISETVSSSKDILRILNTGATAAGEMVTPLPAEAYIPQEDESDARRNRLTRGNSVRSNMANAPTLSTTASSNSKSSSKSRFFKPFRRLPGAPTSPTEGPPPNSPPSRGRWDDSRRRSYVDPGMYQLATSPPRLEVLLMHRSGTRHLGLNGQTDLSYTAYSRYILLEYVMTPDSPVSSTFSGSTKGRLSIDGPSPPRKRNVVSAGTPQLLISYISRGAGELLGLGPIGYERADIFGVLEAAMPGGVGKAFRNAVRERMREGVSATLDITVCRADGGIRKGNVISKMHLEDTPQKRADRIVSYWTPLKDMRDRVGWVVLVVVPPPRSSS